MEIPNQSYLSNGKRYLNFKKTVRQVKLRGINVMKGIIAEISGIPRNN